MFEQPERFDARAEPEGTPQFWAELNVLDDATEAISATETRKKASVI